MNEHEVLVDDDLSLGTRAHELAQSLWGINRSLTGPGVVETLEIIQETLPDLKIRTIPSGTEVFDWVVPKEWHVREAYVVAPDGEKLFDFASHNLHLVGYSQPVRAKLTLEDLQPHLHSLPDQPDAIPYVTSYYGENWGFCLTQNQRDQMKDGLYDVVIDAEHFEGHLTYADLVVPGESEKEILFSTYICHPSMANNELSGPVVAETIAQIVSARPHRKFTYRFVFVPETIGAIAYLSKHLSHLRKNVMAGYVLTCLGDERARSYMPSRTGDSLADRAALAALKGIPFDAYSFLQRGSDERQYCAPGVDLPVCSVMNSKYGTYPEYHTSLDDLSFVTPKGLAAAISSHRKIVEILESNVYPVTTVLGEPQLGKRGLYANLSKVGSATGSMSMRNLIAYADGSQDLIALSDLLGIEFEDISRLAKMLAEHGILRLQEHPS
ncbi:MAG: DUF4910 domain-containing protein [Pseudomonadota bacterium]